MTPEGMIRSGMTKIQKAILTEAWADEGKKEVKGNQGWEDPDFQIQMEATGWELGQSWCAYFAEKVWTNAFRGVKPEMVKLLTRLFSANAVATYRNFEQSKFKTSEEAIPGAVVIWEKMRNGEPVYLTPDKAWVAGHAGIVTHHDYEGGFQTLEGNSNSSGGREGIEVAKLIRKYDFEANHGLRLVGFIQPFVA